MSISTKVDNLISAYRAALSRSRGVLAARRRLDAEIERLEVIEYNALDLVDTIQDHTRESGMTMPREIDIAYLGLSIAIHQKARV